MKFYEWLPFRSTNDASSLRAGQRALDVKFPARTQLPVRLVDGVSSMGVSERTVLLRAVVRNWVNAITRTEREAIEYLGRSVVECDYITCSQTHWFTVN